MGAMMSFRLKIKLVTATFFAALVACGNALAEGENDSFSGVYKEYQVIPNKMAELCKASAEDMINDPTKLTGCVSGLAVKRRSSDAETSREGLKELKEIETEQLLNTIGMATAKAASVADYYAETSKEVSETNANAKTVNDTDSAAIQTSAVLTSVVNGMRDLYVEQLKYLAISNIENLEKETLDAVISVEPTKIDTPQKAEEKEETAKTEDAGENAGGAAVSDTFVATTSDYTPAQSVRYVGDGICKRCVKQEDGNVECREEDCPDGSVITEDHIKYYCEKGICEQVDNRTATDRLKEMAQPDSAVFSEYAGWRKDGGRYLYCNKVIDPEAFGGRPIRECIAMDPPDGNYPIEDDDERVMVCNGGSCKKVKKSKL